jgi:hypothetical protein
MIMKRIIKNIRILKQPLWMLILMVGLSACPPKTKVVSTINRDGSIDQKVIVHSDHDSIRFSWLPIPVDSTNWKYEMHTSDTGSQSVIYRYTLERAYPSADALNQAYEENASQLKLLDRQVKVEKQFNWFFSTLTYREVYKSIIMTVDYHIYMTDQEYEIYNAYEPREHPAVAKLDSAAQKNLLYEIEAKHEKVLYRSLIKTYLHCVDTCMCQMSGQTEPTVFKNHLDSLDFEVLELDIFENEPDERVHTFLQKIYPEEDSVTINQAVQCAEKGSWKTISQQFENALEESYTNCICMDGRLLETNALVVNGDTLCWEVEAERYLANDLVMTAKSKYPNTWAYWITAIIIAIALGLLLYRPKRPGLKRD